MTYYGGEGGEPLAVWPLEFALVFGAKFSSVTFLRYKEMKTKRLGILQRG